MSERIPVVAILDVGKTNKKLLLFNEEYQLIAEQSRQFEEIEDEDGFPCEDIGSLRKWVLETFHDLTHSSLYDLRAINFSAYGASFVHINEIGEPVTPLYNYLKPFPDSLINKFEAQFGDSSTISLETASPFSGNLNSGLQVYGLKDQQPEKYKEVKTSLHLPQYLSFLLTKERTSEITYLGSHSLLWNFHQNQFHQWVMEEGINKKIAPLCSAEHVFQVATEGNRSIPVGIGLHDSSASLIPYLISFKTPYVIISTGTWCISLNPFNHSLPTEDDLEMGCLSYMTYKGKPVKAAMLFAGNDHESQVKRIAAHFNVSADFYKDIQFDENIVDLLEEQENPFGVKDSEFKGGTSPCEFRLRTLNDFNSSTDAYYRLLMDLINQQVISTNLVIKGTNPERIFVDGGFSKNPVYMNLLARAFKGMNVCAVSMAQATALGAALAIHESWNNSTLPKNLITVTSFSLTDPNYTT